MKLVTLTGEKVLELIVFTVYQLQLITFPPQNKTTI